eukprot:2773655-Alexandrium_andersonii.AAC.1
MTGAAREGSARGGRRRPPLAGLGPAEDRAGGRAELDLRAALVEGRGHLHSAEQPEDRRLEGRNLLGAQPAAVRPEGSLQAAHRKAGAAPRSADI